MINRKIRVLIGKPGLDGHDRGAKIVASSLRDAGMEVVYTGLHRTPSQLVDAAEQEDVDVIGLSILSGSHMTLLPQVLSELQNRGLSHVLLVAGGIIPSEDAVALEASGFAKVFGPGTSTGDIANFIKENISKT